MEILSESASELQKIWLIVERVTANVFLRRVVPRAFRVCTVIAKIFVATFPVVGMLSAPTGCAAAPQDTPGIIRTKGVRSRTARLTVPALLKKFAFRNQGANGTVWTAAARCNVDQIRLVERKVIDLLAVSVIPNVIFEHVVNAKLESKNDELIFQPALRTFSETPLT